MGYVRHSVIVITYYYKVDIRSRDRKGEMKSSYCKVREEIDYIYADIICN